MRQLRIKRKDAVLVVIDIQDKLLPAMKAPEELEAAVCKLIRGCRYLDVPVIVTEQYPKGLGGTTNPVMKALTEPLGDGATNCANDVKSVEPIAKTSFSALGEAAFKKRLAESGKNTVILAGIEAHICVQQTAEDLLAAGYKVFVVNDCIASRSNNDRKFAGRRMSEAGAVGTTYESVLFEMVENAKNPGFKEISALVK